MRRPLWSPRARRRIALRLSVVAVALAAGATIGRADESPARPHVVAGIRHADAGRAGEAYAEAQKAIAADPEHADSYDVLGAALYLQHRYEDAIAAHRRASALAPTSSDPHYNMVANYWALGRNDEALQEARAALAIEPECRHCRVALGSTLYRLGRYAEAADETRSVLRSGPGAPDAHYVLGASLTKLGDPRGAVVPLRECIRLAAPEQGELGAECRFLLGSAQLRLRELGPAEETFRALAASEPEGVRARVGLADTLAWQHRFDDAAVELEAAVRLAPKSSWITYRLGVVYGHLRRHDAAVAQLETSVAADPTNAFAVAALVGAYAATGRRDDAAARYESLKKLDPALAARIGASPESCQQTHPEA